VPVPRATDDDHDRHDQRHDLDEHDPGLPAEYQPVYLGHSMLLAQLLQRRLRGPRHVLQRPGLRLVVQPAGQWVRRLQLLLWHCLLLIAWPRAAPLSGALSGVPHPSPPNPRGYPVGFPGTRAPTGGRPRIRVERMAMDDQCFDHVVPSLAQTDSGRPPPAGGDRAAARARAVRCDQRSPVAVPADSARSASSNGCAMRPQSLVRAVLLVAVPLLAAVAVPASRAAAAPTCFGKPATHVM
jgi:hypothetical protein